MPVFTVDQLLAAVPSTDDKHDDSCVGEIQSNISAPNAKAAICVAPDNDNYGANPSSSKLIPKEVSQFKKYPMILTLDKIAMPEATWISTRSDSSFFLNDGVEIQSKEATAIAHQRPQCYKFQPAFAMISGDETSGLL